MSYSSLCLRIQVLLVIQIFPETFLPRERTSLAHSTVKGSEPSCAKNEATERFLVPHHIYSCRDLCSVLMTLISRAELGGFQIVCSPWTVLFFGGWVSRLLDVVILFYFIFVFHFFVICFLKIDILFCSCLRDIYFKVASGIGEKGFWVSHLINFLYSRHMFTAFSL